MRTPWCLLALLLALPARAAGPDFDKDVKPLLASRCVRCHGGERTRAELDARTKAGLLQGGERGPAVVPGAPEKSLLWVLVAADKMPPGKEKLTGAQKALLRAWIEGGAKGAAGPAAPPAPRLSAADRDFWSFRPPGRPVPPAVGQDHLARTPIDRFLLAALEKHGLSLSPPADRTTLLRRVTFGLTGLPPTPEEVQGFLADDRPDAYERVVDRLLASPRYGERWGRHWLDVAGYADSEGILDADYVRSAAWRYRDYVVRALNADKPYDRFLQEQIAGDELSDYWAAYEREKKLPAGVVEALEATGFLRCASDTSRPDFVNIKNAPGYYFQTLDDTVKIVATATLGLTLHCAKCHGHKFDPIPQSEYYRVQAVFMGAYRPGQWVPQVQRRLLEATAHEAAEAARHNGALDAAIAAQTRQRTALVSALAQKLFAERLAALPAALRDDVRVALDTPPAKRDEVQKYLAGKFQAELRPAGAALEQALAKRPDFAAVRQLDGVIAGLRQKKRPPFPEIRALYDLPGTVPTHVLRRGDYLNPGAEVQPGALTVLSVPRPFDWKAPPAGAKTSGRRLAFARWLTQPGHPLTARVVVNRLWLHHFGEGLVATPENFGRSGAAASHPELLDWLATELVRGGWSLKRVHRLIVLSSAYRQSSTFDTGRHARARRLDPDNRLLWRQRLRRLEAEALRDALLAVAGSLNAQMFGPPVPVVRKADGEVTPAAGPAGVRRSLYLQVRRSQPVTILQVFDQPVLETNCTRRSTSTVSSQALTLLNSDFMTGQAAALAARALREAPADPAPRALELALGRPASAKEKALFADFLAKQAAGHGTGAEAGRRALADLCHMLLSANEFAYLD
jgi:hypothetical protein